MASAAALSYLVVGFAGALFLVYFLLQSIRALKLVNAPMLRGWFEANGPSVGGLGFVMPVLIYLYLLSADDVPLTGGLFAGCLILMAVILWDELTSLAERWCFAGQIFAVAVVLWAMGASFPERQWGLVMTSCAAGAVLWHVRLFSHVDGSEGLAALQCLIFCTGVQILTFGVPGWIGDLTWLLAGAVLGVLVFNWPPAKIRIGRAGSGLLGLLLAVIALQLWRSEVLPLVACLILLAGLWFDAGYAACVRILTRYGFGAPRVSAAPPAPSQTRRGCLYQKVAARKGQVWTNVAYLVFGICWLLPLAWLTVRYTRLDLLWLLLAVLPIGIASRILPAAMPAPDEG